MATQVFPVAVSSTGPNSWSINATTSGVVYEGTQAFSTGTYTVTCASSTITSIEFFSGNTSVLQTKTVSGTVTFNLTSAATKVRLWTNTGSNIVVSFALTASIISSSAITMGNLETLTSSGTYTGTSTSGYAYVVAVGGGGGGGAGRSGTGFDGGGGGSGGVASGIVQLTGSISYTVGSQGNGGANSDANGNAGGTTTFANVSANGGGFGKGEGVSNAGAGGTPGGGSGSSGVNGRAAGISDSPFYTFVKNGTTGGGRGGSSQYTYNGVGEGSGIGTGGWKVGNEQVSPSGFGSGGGGGLQVSIPGQSGTQGVVYLMRY